MVSIAAEAAGVWYSGEKCARVKVSRSVAGSTNDHAVICHWIRTPDNASLIIPPLCSLRKKRAMYYPHPARAQSIRLEDDIGEMIFRTSDLTMRLRIS
jgi:hypothetical protein